MNDRFREIAAHAMHEDATPAIDVTVTDDQSHDEIIRTWNGLKCDDFYIAFETDDHVLFIDSSWDTVQERRWTLGEMDNLIALLQRAEQEMTRDGQGGAK